MVVDFTAYFKQVRVELREAAAVWTQRGSRRVIDVRLSMGSASAPSAACTTSMALKEALLARLNCLERARGRPDIVAASQYCDDARYAVTTGYEWAFAAVHEASEALGLPVSLSKAAGQTPRSRATWIGFVIDAARRKVELPPRRQTKILHHMDLALESGQVTGLTDARRLAGLAMSAAEVLACTKPLTSPLFGLLRRTGARPRQSVQLRPYEADALLVLRRAIAGSTGRSFPRPFDGRVDPVIATDASTTGFGAWLAFPGGRRAALRGSWPRTLEPGLMPLAELLAAYLAVHAWRHQLGGRVVRLRSDSTAATSALRKLRSANPAMRAVLQALTLDLAHCDIQLFSQAVSRETNVLADRLSKSCSERTQPWLPRWAQVDASSPPPWAGQLLVRGGASEAAAHQASRTSEGPLATSGAYASGSTAVAASSPPTDGGSGTVRRSSHGWSDSPSPRQPSGRSKERPSQATPGQRGASTPLRAGSKRACTPASDGSSRTLRPTSGGQQPPRGASRRRATSTPATSRRGCSPGGPQAP